MNFTRLEVRVMNAEGFRPKPYLDTVGTPTIGYGTTSIFGHPVTLQTPILNTVAARQLLRGDLYQALVDAQSLFSRLANMNWVRQEILVEMAYNLGKTRLSNFKRLIAVALELNYPRMGDEMEDSRWHGQIGNRGPLLVTAMRSGRWEKTV